MLQERCIGLPPSHNSSVRETGDTLLSKKLIGPLVLVLILATFACTRHHVTADTTHRVEIAPIHVTVDINLKVQRALDDALSFQGGLEDIFTREELEMLKNNNPDYSSIGKEPLQ